MSLSSCQQPPTLVSYRYVIPRDDSMRTLCLFWTVESSFSVSLGFEEVPLVSCLYTAAMVKENENLEKGSTPENLFISQENFASRLSVTKHQTGRKGATT